MVYQFNLRAPPQSLTKGNEYLQWPAVVWHGEDTFTCLPQFMATHGFSMQMINYFGWALPHNLYRKATHFSPLSLVAHISFPLFTMSFYRFN